LVKHSAALAAVQRFVIKIYDLHDAHGWLIIPGHRQIVFRPMQEHERLGRRIRHPGLVKINLQHPN